MDNLDWNDLRALLALVRTGSLRAAAEKTTISPATLSRRIDALESAVGEKLVERLPSGCLVTPTGQRIVACAEQMEEIAGEIARTRDLRASHEPTGTVRINTDEWFSFFLTTRIKAFHERYPRMELEVLTTHRPYSLSRREADISIRPFRPSHPDVVAVRVGVMRFALFGSQPYVECHRQTIVEQDWSKLSFVGFDDLRADMASNMWMRNLPGAPTPRLRCSYALGIYDGVNAGAGLGVLASFAQGFWNDLEPVQTNIEPLAQELWLSYHNGLRDSARIRAVTDYILELTTEWR